MEKIFLMETNDNKSFEDDGFCSLACAIINRAIGDYARAVEFKNDIEIKELEDFFKSEWCNALMHLVIQSDITYSDGELLDIIKKNLDAEISKRRNKRLKTMATINKKHQNDFEKTKENLCAY